MKQSKISIIPFWHSGDCCLISITEYPDSLISKSNQCARHPRTLYDIVFIEYYIYAEKILRTSGMTPMSLEKSTRIA